MKKLLLTMGTSLTLLLGIGSGASAASNTYTVEKGDNLYRIATTNHMTVSELKTWNNLSSDIIKVNQVLKLTNSASASSIVAPNTYTVKQGDTLYRIATTNHMTVSELKTLNSLSSDIIKVNQVLNITNTATSPTNIVREVTAVSTAYTINCKSCSGITSTGINLKQNPNQKVISVDPNVIKLGSTVYVPGYGDAIAGDTGSAIKGNRIDIFMPSEQAALEWGRKTITIQILN